MDGATDSRAHGGALPRDALDQLDDAFVVLELDGRYAYLNAAAARLLGVPAGALVGRSVWDVHPTLRGTPLGALIDDALARRGPVPPPRVTVRVPPGRWVAVCAVPSEEAGVVVLHGCEVTARVRRERWAAAQTEVLQMIATDRPLGAVLDALCRAIEAVTADALASVLLRDPVGDVLHPGAAPSLPADYVRETEGLAIGPAHGSCGTAAHRAALVVTPDIGADPLWARHRALAERFGLRACWSHPILGFRGGAAGPVLGTFAVYYREPRVPDVADLALVAEAAHLASVAITRAQTDQALRQHEQEIASLVENSPDLVARVDRELRYRYVGPQIARATGRPPDAFLGRVIGEVHAPPEIARAWQHAAARARDGGTPTSLTVLYPSEGGPRWLDACLVPERDPQGAVASVLLVARDVTRLREAHAALAASEARYAAVLEAVQEAVVEVDAEGRWRYLSRAWEAITGHDVASRLGRPVLDDLAPEDRARAAACFQSLVDGTRDAYATTLRIVRADGEVRWCDARGRALRDDDGRLLAVLSVLSDVSERVAAAAALRRSEERYRLAMEATGEVLVDADLLDGRVAWAGAVAAVLGYEPATIDPDVSWLHARLHPDDVARAHAAYAALRRDHGDRWELTVRFRHADGRWLHLEAHGLVVRDAEGRATRCVGAVRDVTERRRMADALAESQSRLALALEAARMGTWRWVPSTGVLHWSEGMGPLFGLPRGAPAPDFDHFLEPLHPEDRARLAAEVEGVVAHGTTFETEFRVVLADGSVRWLSDRGRVTRDAAGRAVHIDGVVTDVTERKDAERTLAERDAQLQHARRLEALGRLAGGVAHDFNNLLTVIRNNADFALDALAAGHPAAADVHEIVRAAERAAALTRQLLAVGRRQTLRPETLDVRALLRDVVPLVQRLVGRHIAVELELDGPGALVRIDPTQLEQVLLNLAANARDAMGAAGGTLTLTLGRRVLDAAEAAALAGPDEARLAPGPYVTLAVRDGGPGMDAATRARIFEPFFTTKPFGKGTGLGLATVHGIMLQMHGAVSVASEPGAGTTFTLYLPAVGDAASPPPDAAARDPEPGLAAPATVRPLVLLAEDEGAVRAVVRRMLERDGYAVVEAGDGAEALEHFTERLTPHGHPPPPRAPWALVISDVLMPRVDGVELARRLRALSPTIPIVLMSGYSAEAIGDADALPPGLAIVEKPPSAAELRAAIAAATSDAPVG